MENKIALVNKLDKRVKNILIVDSLDENEIKMFETDEIEVIPVKNSIPYLYGLWDGKKFIEPDNDYLLSIGIVSNQDNTEAEAKATAKSNLLKRLGITEEEARLLLS